MIFVTVGTQLPFERLVHAVIYWADKEMYKDIVFQVGPEGPRVSGYPCFEYLEPEEFTMYINDSDFIVSHAGMGIIIKSLEQIKPLIIMPRRAALLEHRSDHQVYTAARFSTYAGIHVVNDELELYQAVTRLKESTSVSRISSDASEQLLKHIHSFISDKLL